MPLTTARVRPGPAGVRWLADRIRAAKGGDRLAPVMVVVPNHQVGLALRRGLAETGYANVTFTVLVRLAEMIGAPPLAAAGRAAVTTVTRAALVREAVRRTSSVLAPAIEHQGLIDDLVALFTELRRRPDVEWGTAGVDAAAGRSGVDALNAFAAYCQMLEEHRLYDEVDLLDGAGAAVEDGREGAVLSEVGAVIAYLPTAVVAPEARMLNALGSNADVTVALLDASDGMIDAASGGQAGALGVEWHSITRAAPPSAAPPHTHTLAVDAAEEVRGVVRRILAGMDAEPPVALHRTAVLYRSENPYAALVRDTLRSAGLPFAALDGKALSESIVGRGLLGLIRLPVRDFARPAVLSWLSSLPPHREDRLSVARWDALSREAGVVRGATQWADRLRRLAGERRREAEGLTAERDGDDSEARIASRRRVADDAEAIAGRVLELERATMPPTDTTWPAHVAWVQGLRTAFLRTERDWEDDEVEMGQLVDQVLEGLTAAAAMEPSVSLTLFVNTLDHALARRRRPEGRLGTGVVIGPLSAAVGMAFDRVHLVGLTERAFPTALPVDPLFGGADPLGRRAAHLADERRAFVAALAAADAGEVSLSAPMYDVDGRPAYPSAWFLEGTTVLPSRLRDPGAVYPWLTRIGSAESALAGAPAMLTLAERRTHEAWSARHEHGPVRAIALAERDDVDFGHVLAVQSARRSHALTEYDGNLSAIAHASRDLAVGLGGRSLSATAIQEWAVCPFRYLMGRVIRVQQTDRPEADATLWSMSALDRGSLVHEILDAFFRELRTVGRPALAEVFSDADHERIESLARETFAEAEVRGVTGHPLVWANERTAIIRDLHTFLREDERGRGEVWVPELFEQRFGMGGPTDWPEARVPVGDGRSLALHGIIDRIDWSADGARVRVIDYKTGTAQKEAPSAANRLRAGSMVQLPVYGLAVREWARAAGRPDPQVESMYWYATTRGEFKQLPVTVDDGVARSMEEVATIIDEGLRTGAFPQAPGEFEDRGYMSGWKNCRYCPYTRMCPAGRDAVHQRKSGDASSALHGRLAEGAGD